MLALGNLGGENARDFHLDGTGFGGGGFANLDLENDLADSAGVVDGFGDFAQGVVALREKTALANILQDVAKMTVDFRLGHDDFIWFCF